MKAEKLINALKDCSQQPYEYSGRGMFGRTCVAVDVDSDSDLFKLGIRLAAISRLPDHEELLLLRPRTDTMGRGTVIYFPTVEWPKTLSDAEALASCDEELDS